MSTQKHIKLDIILLAALRKKDIDIPSLATMSASEIAELPLPGTLLKHVTSFARRYAGRDEKAIQRAIDVAALANEHKASDVEVPSYDPATERELIADSYTKVTPTEEAEPIVTEDLVKEKVDVDVVAYSEDELRDAVSKVDGKTYKVILKNAVEVLETAAIDDKLLIKVVKDRVAELKAQK